MTFYSFTEEENNLLMDVRRQVGFMQAIACAVVGENVRVDVRASELVAVFSYIEQCIAEVLDAAGERASAAARLPDDLRQGLHARDIKILADSAGGIFMGPCETRLREQLGLLAESDPDWDRVRVAWEKAVASHSAHTQ